MKWLIFNNECICSYHSMCQFFCISNMDKFDLVVALTLRRNDKN